MSTTEWFDINEEMPPLDNEHESPYLLVLSDRAVCPLAAYYDGTRGAFYVLGAPGVDALRGVRAWAYMPRAPRRFYAVHPGLLKHAEQSDLIEDE